MMGKLHLGSPEGRETSNVLGCGQTVGVLTVPYLVLIHWNLGNGQNLPVRVFCGNASERYVYLIPETGRHDGNEIRGLTYKPCRFLDQKSARPAHIHDRILLYRPREMDSPFSEKFDGIIQKDMKISGGVRSLNTHSRFFDSTINLHSI